MATIKSYTDINQSKKLAEILPLESADMHYVMIDTENEIYSAGLSNYIGILPHYPCWSLASLLEVLPMIRKGEDTANPFISKTPDGEYYVVYATLTKEVDNSDIYDNAVDACYEMMLRLHELKML